MNPTDKETGSYSYWAAKYDGFGFAEILEEVARMPEVASINRSCALLVRLIDIAANDSGLSDSHRGKVVELAVAIRDAIRTGLSNTDQTAAGRFESVLESKLKNVRDFALYPDIATVLTDHPE